MIQFGKKVFYTLRSVANHPLNRSARVRSALRFCLTQVAARMVPGDICVGFPNGAKLLVPQGMKGAAHYISPGLYEFDEMCFVMHFLRPGDVFVDVGANLGAYTVLASAGVGAKTVAFEPNPFVFEYLLQNVRLNDLGNKVTPLNTAVGGAVGTVQFTKQLGTENHVSTDGATADTVEVKVTTLDIAIKGCNPTLIKVDVEGFEPQVFQGADQTLRRSDLEALIVERSGLSSRYGAEEDKLHAHLRELGFVPCVYCGLSRVLTIIHPDAHGNILYLRDVQLAQKRLSAAPRFHFAGVEI